MTPISWLCAAGLVALAIGIVRIVQVGSQRATCDDQEGEGHLRSRKGLQIYGSVGVDGDTYEPVRVCPAGIWAQNSRFDSGTLPLNVKKWKVNDDSSDSAEGGHAGARRVAPRRCP